MTPTRRPRVVAVIPARYASTRLPGKPLADIDGKPMIRHVVERVGRASLVSAVIVATDDDRIAAAVTAFGGTAVMTSPDLASGTDRVAAVAATLPDADIIVNVQGDEPLIPAAMVDEAIRPLVDDPEITCGTLVRAVTADADLTNAAVVKVVLDGRGDALYFSRSAIPFLRDVRLMDWTRTHTFYRHIGLYVFRRGFLLTLARLPQTPLERAEKLEQLRMLEAGGRIRATVTTYDSIAVDTPDDLERVRRMMRGT
jgi:3-deoxy-manno-octulosonate cytidylyltransferase (CMP-KDO synthetase)